MENDLCLKKAKQLIEDNLYYSYFDLMQLETKIRRHCGQKFSTSDFYGEKVIHLIAANILSENNISETTDNMTMVEKFIRRKKVVRELRDISIDKENFDELEIMTKLSCLIESLLPEDILYAMEYGINYYTFNDKDIAYFLHMRSIVDFYLNRTSKYEEQLIKYQNEVVKKRLLTRFVNVVNKCIDK